VAVLWGEGGAFCSGFDLKHAGSMVGAQRPLEALEYPACDQEELPPGGHKWNRAARGHEWNRAARGPMGPTRMELDKPVIAAIAGPAVAGGFELALWCDVRVMEASAYFGVYCRRWGVPLIDGGTVRLPRIVGMGRAMELILTGRKLPADEALRIGACEQVVADGESRKYAEAMAHEVARFPQACMRADRRSLYRQQGLTQRDAMRYEWMNGIPAFVAEGAQGAQRFASGKGRHGSFGD
jgi:enoyl-CoA hydratase